MDQSWRSCGGCAISGHLSVSSSTSTAMIRGEIHGCSPCSSILFGRCRHIRASGRLLPHYRRTTRSAVLASRFVTVYFQLARQWRSCPLLLFVRRKLSPMPRQRSNRAMERTAARHAFTSFVVTMRTLRSVRALGGGRSSWSRSLTSRPQP